MNKILCLDRLYLLLDGICFTVISALLSFVILYGFIQLDYIHLSTFFLWNFIIWGGFSIIRLHKTLFRIAIGLLTLALIVIGLHFYAMTPTSNSIRDYFAAFSRWLYLSAPSPSLLDDSTWGLTFIILICSASFLALVFFYFLRNRKIALLFLSTILFGVYFLLSLLYPLQNFLLLFFANTLPLFYLFTKKTNPKSRLLLYGSPLLLAAIMVLLLPIDYQHPTLVSKGNEHFTTIVNRSEFLQRFSSRITSNDSLNITLGGELIQTGETHFFLSGSPGLLRTHVYDEYTGLGFKKNSSDIAISSKKESSEPIELFLGHDYSYEIKFQNYYSNTLPTAYATLDVTALSDTSPTISLNSYGEYEASDYFIKGDTYQMSFASQISSLSAFDETKLLQLPDTVTPRTRELAHRLAEEAIDEVSTTYNLSMNESGDIVSSTGDIITPEELDVLHSYAILLKFLDFLEANYPYTKTPPRMVTDDFVDNFLFESKEGYCTSFAASMVVMLRIVDIPCRYVVGYNTQLSFSPSNEPIAVTDYDKHAWVEIASAEFGFLPIDPTPLSYSDEGSVSTEPDSILDEIIEEEGTNADFQIEENSELIEETPLPDNNSQESAAEDAHEADSRFNLSTFWKRYETYFYSFGSMLLLLSSITLFIHYRRKRILNTLSSSDPLRLYNLLLKLLKRFRVYKSDSETVREFFTRLQTQDNLSPLLQSVEVDKFVKPIEERLYSKNSLNECSSDCTALTDLTRDIYQKIRSRKLLFKGGSS